MSKACIRTALLRRALLTTAAAAVVSAAATTAMAGSFALREQSATGQGMSFAGMAAGGGDSISGMFWNPAVVNQVVGIQGEQHVTGIFPDSDIKLSDGTKAGITAITGGLGSVGDSGNIGQSAVLTAGYNAYRINERVAVGLAINSPFGLVTDPKTNWGGQVLSRSSKVLSVNVQPTVGVSINEWLSIAGGLQIQYFDIKLKRATSPLPNAQTAKLTGDDIGVGFTAGFTVKPIEGTEIGVGFRSKIVHDLDGELDAPGFNPDIQAKVTLPEMVSVGIRQRITDTFTLNAGAEWTNWSRLGKVKVRGAAPVLTELPFDYDDGYFFSVGGEYDVSQAFTVRAGVGYELAPIDNKNRDTRLPDDDRWWLSAGLTYRYDERFSADLGYSYVFVPGKSKIDLAALSDRNPLPVAISGRAETDVHIVSAALRYKFGGDAPAVLVTKN